MSEEPRKRSSLRNAGGVAEVLRHVQEEMLKRVAARLQERSEQGRSNLAEAEVETIARIVAQITREVCANAVGEAYQMGVNANARAEDYERDTVQPKKG